MSYIGVLIVLGCVVGGFVLEKGPLAVLFQPIEFLIIGGAIVGGLVISLSARELKTLQGRALSAYAGTPFTAELALELVRCLYQISILVKREGVISLETHIADPAQSAIFAAYPKLLAQPALIGFLADALRLQVDGAVDAHELEAILEREVRTTEEEGAFYPAVVQKVGDSLPGLGIVAAVLGVIITMSHLDGPPEEIGHHVAVALTGTFIGILLSYGFAQPTTTAMEKRVEELRNFQEAIQIAMISFAEGKAPVVVAEMARRTFHSYNRPTREAVEEGCQAARAA